LRHPLSPGRQPFSPDPAWRKWYPPFGPKHTSSSRQWTCFSAPAPLPRPQGGGCAALITAALPLSRNHAARALAAAVSLAPTAKGAAGSAGWLSGPNARPPVGGHSRWFCSFHPEGRAIAGSFFTNGLPPGLPPGRRARNRNFKPHPRPRRPPFGGASIGRCLAGPTCLVRDTDSIVAVCCCGAASGPIHSIVHLA